MASRHFPVRPNLDQLKHQAKDLLRAIRRSDSEAVADLREYQPKSIDPASARLADAQLVLARSYGLPSWPRLVTACRMTDAIWHGNVETVRAMVLRNPRLLSEDARGVEGNWGPPMSYAANLGQDGIVEILRSLGASDLQFAFGRACLQGQVETARKLQAMMGNPRPPDDELSGPAYTRSMSRAPRYCSNSVRGCTTNTASSSHPLALCWRPTVAIHLSSIASWNSMLSTGSSCPIRQQWRYIVAGSICLKSICVEIQTYSSEPFTHEEIYPPELGCQDEVLTTNGTPLAGATLLHMCADYDEIEIARWLLDRGMNVDQQTAVDPDGFGGHTALFATVVSQPNFWMNLRGHVPEPAFTRLLLDHGANPNRRASLRKQLHPGYEIDGMHEYRNVTPIGWGEKFHFKKLVNLAAIALIAERGGQP